jgi:hypothetical protein
VARSFPEPVQAIVTIPLGAWTKLVGKALTLARAFSRIAISIEAADLFGIKQSRLSDLSKMLRSVPRNACCPSAWRSIMTVEIVIKPHRYRSNGGVACVLYRHFLKGITNA